MDAPLAAALRAGGITVALLYAAMFGGALAGWIRHRTAPKIQPSHLLGTALILAVPLAFAVPLAALGGAAAFASGSSPFTYPFVTLAALAWLAPALKANAYGMHGCTRMFGIFSALYVAAWGAVMFHMTGGLEHLADAETGITLLKPPLAALPFALLVTKLVGRKRTRWTFLQAWLPFMGFMAICYFPVEAGVAGAVLPGSAWLRYPLAGFAIGVGVSMVRLLGLLGGPPTARLRRIRAMPRQMLLAALVVAPTGLAWAAARAVLGGEG